MSIYRVLLCVILCGALGLSACGGGSSAPPPAPPPGDPPPPPPPPGGDTISAPIAVTVTPGATASGVNISVPTKAGGEPNAQMLGVTPVGQSGTAQNTGASIRRGENMRVILFGTGLSGDMEVEIGGPDDIQVSNIQGITSTSGTPGISFQVAVSGNAALGARTVFLRRDNNITTFTGGLEVVP